MRIFKIFAEMATPNLKSFENYEKNRPVTKIDHYKHACRSLNIVLAA